VDDKGSEKIVSVLLTLKTLTLIGVLVASTVRRHKAHRQRKIIAQVAVSPLHAL